MMKEFFLFVSIFLCSIGYSQIEFSAVKYDFGDLESYDVRYFDLRLKNRGAKEAWVLTVKKPREVSYITSKPIISADSSVLIRLHVNPSQKGRFSYEVNVFTSDRAEATKIKIQGNLKDLQQDNGSAFTACPTFSDRPGGRNPSEFDLTVVTIDKETREELANSIVTMIQGGREVWRQETNRKGKIKEDATLGLSYFVADHEGYYTAELGAYVNFKRNYIVVELEKDKTVVVEEPPVIEPPIIDTTVIAINDPQLDPEPEIIIEIDPTPEPEHEVPEETVVETTPPPPGLTALDEDNFDEAYFDPVNIVFILDVSSSMKQVDKIELMKYSLMQLTDMLRPQDKFGIVTYASDARVLLKPTSGREKEAIKEEIAELKAFGYTSGGSGIKLGYKTAKRAKITHGKNHVIIITDGAFNRNSDDYKRYIKKYRKKGITMSVVGIRNKSSDEDEMKEAAELGGGNYVPIMKLADAKRNLKQEVRLQSYKF